MKTYIAGPMSGLPDWNFPAFFETAERLQTLGHDTVNPADNDGRTLAESLTGAHAAKDAGATWADYLKRDIPRLMPCDAVCVLPGWQQSRGATLEVDIATRLGLPILCLVETVETVPLDDHGDGPGFVKTSTWRLVPRVRAVGLSGYARTGKDTVGRFLVGLHGFERASFADKLRELAVAVAPTVPTYNGHTRRLDALVRANGWEPIKDRYPEVRRLLQQLGTGVRDIIGENVWVDLAFRGLPDGTRVVFTDVRFPNEAAAIKAAGGQVWRIDRPEHGPVNGHPSETALDDYPFDARILNDGTVFDLDAAIGHILGRPAVLPGCEWCGAPLPDFADDFCTPACERRWRDDDRAAGMRHDHELDEYDDIDDEDGVDDA